MQKVSLYTRYDWNRKKKSLFSEKKIDILGIGISKEYPGQSFNVGVWQKSQLFYRLDTLRALTYKKSVAS